MSMPLREPLTRSVLETYRSPVFFEVHSHVALDQFLNFCTPNEHIQFESLPAQKRSAWLTGRYVAKMSVQKMFRLDQQKDIPLSAIEIHNTDMGVPYATLLPAGDRIQAHLSISHTTEYACGAVSSDQCVHALGVDIERLRVFPEETQDAFLTPSEREFVRVHTGAHQMYYATLFWSIKEAYLKACGVGLRTHPRLIDCTLNTTLGTCTVHHGGVPVELQSVYWTTIDDLYILAIITI